MIRLAVRCAPEQAEIVLAELMVLAPNGVEEEQGPGYVEYAIYGGEGELPELGEIEAAAGEGLVEVVSTEVPDDWADRWQDFHRPILVGDRLWLRPSWEEAREGTIDVVVDPGRAFGTGAHPTTRLCLELLLELAAGGRGRGPADRPRDRLRPARDRRRQARLEPGLRIRPRAALDRGGDSQRRGQRRRRSRSSAATSARACRRLAPTTVANLTAPVLHEVAVSCGVGDGRARRSLPLLLRSPPRSTLVCSGLLPSELDEIAGAFAAAGLVEADRRLDGDWAALLLRRR